MMTRDEFGELDAKRFMNPIPSKNMILKFPMSAPLKDAVANPTDKGV